jgi:hypothetical protein
VHRMRASSADYDFVYFMFIKSVHLQFSRFRHAPMTIALGKRINLRNYSNFGKYKYEN